MAKGHSVRLPIIGTILFLTNLVLPYKSTGFDTCPVGKKRLRSYDMYIPFCVKRTLKLQLGTINMALSHFIPVL